MEENKTTIWVYRSMKKGTYDNDYYFYEDGTILHHYDLSVRKNNLESYVSPENISNSEKEKIISQCESECSPDVVNQIKHILGQNE